MASQPNQKEFWTVEAYLELDDASEIRYEYLDGEIYAMSGGTPRHSKITHNINGIFFNQLEDGLCGGFESNLRVSVSETQYVYPDFTVVCGEAIFSEGKDRALLNPTMLVEIVSESSKQRDYIEKLHLYQNIASLEIYLIVEQESPYVTVYSRRSEGWLMRSFLGLDAILSLEQINATMKLKDLYRRVDFEADDLIE